MIRNMEKVVSETRGKIPRGYNLSCDECIRLVKMAVGGVIPTAHLKQFAQPLITALHSEKDVKKDKRKPPQKSRGKSIAGAIPLHKQYSITFPAERKDTMRKYPLPPPRKRRLHKAFRRLQTHKSSVLRRFYSSYMRYTRRL